MQIQIQNQHTLCSIWMQAGGCQQILVPPAQSETEDDKNSQKEQEKKTNDLFICLSSGGAQTS